MAPELSSPGLTATVVTAVPWMLLEAGVGERSLVLSYLVTIGAASSEHPAASSGVQRRPAASSGVQRRRRVTR